MKSITFVLSKYAKRQKKQGLLKISNQLLKTYKTKSHEKAIRKQLCKNQQRKRNRINHSSERNFSSEPYPG